MSDETEALHAEVAELRAEVDRLRAWVAGHTCMPAAPSYPQPVVNIPPTTTIRPWTNVCAGGNYPQVLTFPDATGANPAPINFSSAAFVAGCAAPAPTVTFNVPV